MKKTPQVGALPGMTPLGIKPTESKEAGHTPGPWWIDDAGFIAAGSGDDYKTIADPHCMEPSGNESEMEANARLIAASPSLLEDFRRCLQLANCQGNAEDVSLAMGEIKSIALAAIQSATATR